MSNFWIDKPLHALTGAEWEALCDGCGLCCMHKFEDEDSGDVLYTRVACRLFDDASCRCRDYGKRLFKVPDCLNLHSLKPEQMSWLPPTCAYRLRFEGKPLPSWHYLVTGNPDSVHQLGISIKGRSISEDSVPEDQWPDYAIDTDRHTDD